MKKLLKKVIAAMLCMGLFLVVGCKKDNPVIAGGGIEEPIIEISLEYTKWKAAGIVDAKTGILTKLRPEDCDMCYTIKFMTDSTFGGKAENNTYFGKYEFDTATHTMHISGLSQTFVGSWFDEELYLWSLRDVHSCFIEDNKLQLYFNEDHYLLFNFVDYEKK